VRILSKALKEGDEVGVAVGKPVGGPVDLLGATVGATVIKFWIAVGETVGADVQGSNEHPTSTTQLLHVPLSSM
jgi:hypothetical protein